MNQRQTVAGCLWLGLAFLVARAAETGEPAAADRVGFPAGYAEKFQVLRAANKPKVHNLGTIYANERAASVTETGQLPYPEGSVIVMDWAEPLKADDGTVITGPDGLWQKGKVVRVDVMRRERGYGEAYGDKRAGEWEFASYLPDGTRVETAGKPASCAQCHQKATAARDFVFQGRFPPLQGN